MNRNIIKKMLEKVRNVIDKFQETNNATWISGTCSGNIYTSISWKSDSRKNNNITVNEHNDLGYSLNEEIMSVLNKQPNIFRGHITLIPPSSSYLFYIDITYTEIYELTNNRLKTIQK